MAACRSAAGPGAGACDAMGRGVIRRMPWPAEGSPVTRSAPAVGVCTRGGGCGAGRRQECAPGMGVCTRNGGAAVSKGGCLPPYRVHTPIPGADLGRGRPELPPYGVHTPAAGADLGEGGGVQPVSPWRRPCIACRGLCRALTPWPGADPCAGRSPRGQAQTLLGQAQTLPRGQAQTLLGQAQTWRPAGQFTPWPGADRCDGAHLRMARAGQPRIGQRPRKRQSRCTARRRSDPSGPGSATCAHTCPGPEEQGTAERPRRSGRSVCPRGDLNPHPLNGD